MSTRPPKARRSDLEVELAFQLRALGIAFEEEHPFAQEVGRRFRADFAFPDHKLLVEIEGGVWSKGSHGRGSGIVRDMEKANLAVQLGWRLLRFTGDQVRSGEAATMIEQELRRAGT